MKKLFTKMLLPVLCICLLLTACNNIKQVDFNVYESNNIISMLKTEDIMTLAEFSGVIYAAGTDGVYKIDKKDNTYIPQKLTFNKELTYVKTLFIDDAGMLWIGYEYGILLYNLTTKEETYYTEENSFLPNDRVNIIYKDSKNVLWIGTWGGVCYQKNGEWQTITKESGLIEDNVNVICEDHLGGMWFGSYAVRNGGASYFYNDTWKTYGVNEGLLNENITAILEDSKGILWVGGGMYTQGGAVGFSLINNEWKITEKITIDSGLAGEKVRSIYKDSKGRLYFGSEYDGLAIMNNGETEIINESSGLVQNEVKAILEASDGHIWLGTRYGISVLE